MSSELFPAEESSFDKAKEAEKSAKQEQLLLAKITTLTLDLAAAKKTHAAQQALTRRILILGEDALKEQQSFLDDAKAHLKGETKKPVKAGSKPAAVNGHAKGPFGGLKVHDGADQPWRDLPVKDAITIGAVLNGLEDQEHRGNIIRTLGQLVDWLNDGGGFAKIKGVAEKKAHAAEDQMIEFWAAHPEYCEAG